MSPQQYIEKRRLPHFQIVRLQIVLNIFLIFNFIFLPTVTAHSWQVELKYSS